MPPKKVDAGNLNADQVTLLVKVITRTQASLDSSAWEDIAREMGISNGRAA